ncbi:hypothetical protein GA0061096_2984 [Fictibacillus enclensis]|nr:hypothetical protein GA0061096_2984 [Fictibacillus enclensis]
MSSLCSKIDYFPYLGKFLRKFLGKFLRKFLGKFLGGFLRPAAELVFFHLEIPVKNEHHSQ